MMFEEYEVNLTQFCDDVWGLWNKRNTVLWWCLRFPLVLGPQFCDDVWGENDMLHTVLWWCLRWVTMWYHSFVMMFEVYGFFRPQFCDDVWGKPWQSNTVLWWCLRSNNSVRHSFVMMFEVRPWLPCTVLWWCLRLFSEWPTVLYVLNSNKLELSFAASAGNIISLLNESIDTI